MCAEYLNQWLIFIGATHVSLSKAVEVRQFKLDRVSIYKWEHGYVR